MYSKNDQTLADCFCGNNNNIGDTISLYVMGGKSSQLEGKRRKRRGVNGERIDKSKDSEIRKEEVMAIRTRFPNKIPVIVQKYWKDNQLPQLDKSKFLVPQDITMSQFQTIIRNRMRMTQNQALYLLVNERTMMSLSLTLGEIYSEHAGPNGFLYVTYASQEAFGSTEQFNLEEIEYKEKIDTNIHENTKSRTKLEDDFTDRGLSDIL